MEQEKIEQFKELYSKYKNLKIVSEHCEVPWQTIYWWLKKENYPVVGDKERYGGYSDRIGLIGEKLFIETFPEAIENNKSKYQAKFDFTLYGLSIDIKTSTLTKYKGKEGTTLSRWALNLKKDRIPDFTIGYCLDGEQSDCKVSKIILLPSEIIAGMSTVSLSSNGSKWDNYQVTRDELIEFFNSFKE